MGAGIQATATPVESITVWHRVEPQPRANLLPDDDVIWRSLSARIRDPAWLLTRQWQLGEFFGADSGSPAFGKLALQVSPFTSYQQGSGPREPWPDGAPLEALV